MADDTPQDSKTFDPTPQRIQQFRDDGKVASSKDVISAVMFIMALIAFSLIGQDLFMGFGQAIRTTIEQIGQDGGRSATLWTTLSGQLGVIGPPASNQVSLGSQEHWLQVEPHRPHFEARSDP
jgi:flagellar biosynthesis protein FlhB